MIYRFKLWLHDKLRDRLSLCCGAEGPCFRKGRRQRQNTSYCDDERNWVIACDPCMETIQEHWNEMWAEYYAGVL